MKLDPRHARRSPGRIGRRVAAWLALAASGATQPALAQSEDPDETAPTRGWRWEGSNGATPAPSPLLAPIAAPFGPVSPLPRPAPEGVPPIDYRLWYGDRRTEIGIGLANTPGAVLALRQQVSPHSRLIVDTRLGSDGTTPASRVRGFPLGIELESSPWHGLAKGQLLRAQLDLRTSVAVRLRGGRVGVYLQVRTSGD